MPNDREEIRTRKGKDYFGDRLAMYKNYKAAITRKWTSRWIGSVQIYKPLNVEEVTVSQLHNREK